MSGEFHYSRCPEAQWRDRLERLAAMGLNAVATVRALSGRVR